LGSVVAAVLAVIIIAFWPEKKEPEYRGKKLSEWLHGQPLFVQVPGGRNAWMEEQSGEAVRHIGTNALPFLVKWLRYERPAWRDKASAAYEKWPGPLFRHSMARWLSRGKPERLSDAAMVCFQFLGPDAAPAVPELIGMLKDSKAPLTSKRAVFCLGCIGPKARAAVPYLRQLARASRSDISLDATMAIYNIEPSTLTRK